MKKIIVFLVLILVFKGNAQSFEGKVEYVVSTEILGDSLLHGVSKKKLVEKLISQGEIPIDTLNYIYSEKGDFVSIWKYGNIDMISNYIKKDNLLYNFVGDLNVVSAIDVTIDLEEKLGNPPVLKELEQKEKVGNLECSIVEVRWKMGTYRYYFSNSILKIDSELFKGYNYDQFYEFLKISNSLPVKIEKITKDFFKSTYLLHSYTTKKVDKSVFTIPRMKEDKMMRSMYQNKKFFIIK
ncbi:hypothetical protein D0809_23780 [Flavobacterium circumlabens]|uniref:DUF4412 domain-containing protein n=1 Tax=Flavobacterium circumlabens TaxID=2133765 RepID=A0A4Y7U6A7_9FLAO|nr:hypothetical protein [Flavobacterium circumlabens]TCN50338.1 hypothetical protein EV142_11611 [Flavobacterium circumlabens]TEB41764.1 hypothetical protein D0809_23780 [Flavobacterium circumlabens]